MLKFMFDVYLAANGIRGITSDSAGLSGGGKPVSEYTKSILKKHGVPYTERLSVVCGDELVCGADAIFTMTRAQERELSDRYGEGKIFSLSRIAGNDIKDPYGGAEEEYEKTFSAFEKLLPLIVEFISK